MNNSDRLPNRLVLGGYYNQARKVRVELAEILKLYMKIVVTMLLAIKAFRLTNYGKFEGQRLKQFCLRHAVTL